MPRPPSPIRPAGRFAPALALVVAGCAGDGSPPPSLEDSVQPRWRARGEVMALAPTPGGRAPAWDAMQPSLATLPDDAGPPGSTLTRAYADGLRQDVVLDGARVRSVHNGITMVARTGGGDPAAGYAPLHPPSEAMIRSEIGAALPGVRMQVIERQRSNGYGPYGLALGRTGADVRCLYMWQWIDADRLPRDRGLAGPVSLRVRLCRTAATFDEMAGWLDRLRLAPAAPSLPAAGDEARILPPDGPVDPAAPAAAVERGRPPRLPADQHDGRRRLAGRRRPTPATLETSPAEARLPNPARATAPAAAGGGFRYPSADDAMPVARRGPMPSAAPAPSFRGDLPPEAFAGPRAVVSPPRS